VVKVFDHSVRVDNKLQGQQVRARYGLAPTAPAPYHTATRRQSRRELHSKPFNINTSNPVPFESSFGHKGRTEGREGRTQKRMPSRGGGSSSIGRHATDKRVDHISRQHEDLMVDMALRPPRGVLTNSSLKTQGMRKMSANADDASELSSLRRDILYLPEGPRLRPMELD
jgi:hypothetical protein